MDKVQLVFSISKAKLIGLLGDEEVQVRIRRGRNGAKANGHNGAGRAAKRRYGPSRIFTIIKRALHEGPQPNAQLKLALEAAGLSSQSLGPGITALLRRGVIVRHSQGVYGLARNEPQH